MKVAIVDDDPAQIQLIMHALTALGHECHGFERGQALMRQMRRNTFDFLILDWHLPDVNGPDIVAWIRNKFEHHVPILFVTNRSQEQDLVSALAIGADDYLTKPVRMGELAARVTALMRRSYPTSAAQVESYGHFSFDTRRRSLSVNGKRVELKQREYLLAHLLFQNLDRLLARQYLLDKLWGVNPEIWSRSLDTHVSNLRVKLSLRPESGYRLTAVYGVGYRLERIDDVEAAAPTPSRKASQPLA